MRPYLVQRRVSTGATIQWIDQWEGDADDAEQALHRFIEESDPDFPDFLIDCQTFRVGILPVWETFEPELEIEHTRRVKVAHRL